MADKKQVAKHLDILKRATEQDLDQLLYGLLERTHPTERSQRN